MFVNEDNLNQYENHRRTRTWIKADASMADILVVAVTNRPGLKGPLNVGTDYAKVSFVYQLDNFVSHDIIKLHVKKDFSIL